MLTLYLIVALNSLAIAGSYSDPQGFNVTFPDEWVIHPGAQGMKVFGMSKMADKNMFITNASIMTTRLRSESLDNYFNASLKHVEQASANYKLQDSGSTQINGREAKWAVYQATMQGVSGTIMQYMIRNGKQVVILTAVDSMDQFSADRSIFEGIASSIHFERDLITPQRDESAPVMRKEIMPTKVEKSPQRSTPSKIQPRKEIFKSAPGDADMPARLYYEKP